MKMAHNICGKCLFEMQRLTRKVKVWNFKRIATQTTSFATSYERVKDGTRIAAVTVYDCPSCGNRIYRTELDIVGINGEKEEGDKK
jgi:ribosomal protein L32